MSKSFGRCRQGLAAPADQKDSFVFFTTHHSPFTTHSFNLDSDPPEADNFKKKFFRR